MKKTLKNLTAGCLLLICAWLLVPAVNAQAAELTQKSQTKNSVTISWTPESRAVRYLVYVGEDYSNRTLYAAVPASQTEITITDLAPGSRRYIRVEYEYSSYGGSTYTGILGYMSDARTLPGQVTGVRQERWYYFIQSFDAQWDRMDGADGYQYRVKNAGGKKVRSGKLEYNSPGTSVSKISNSMVYTMEVRAYAKINNKVYWGPWSDKAYFFTQPQVKSVSAGAGALTVRWGKVAGATGYDVYVSARPKKGYKKVKSVKSAVNSVTVAKFGGNRIKDGKTYYVYVVTKKKVGKRTFDSGKLYYWDTKSSSFNYF